MEKRAILAALLMAGLLMIYQLLFVKPPERQPPAAPQTKEATPAPSSIPPLAPSPPPAPLPKEGPPVPEGSAVVETPLYRAEIGSSGGRIEAWNLYFRGEKAMVLPGLVASQGLLVLRAGQPPRPIQFSLSAKSLKLGKDSPEAELRLIGEDEFGLRVTQILRFRADRYTVEHHLSVENRHTVAQSAELALTWASPIEWPKEQEHFGGARPIHIVRLAKGEAWARREVLSKAENYLGDAQWVGFESGVAPTGQNGVYLTALIPKSAGFKVTEGKQEAPKANGQKTVQAAEVGVRAMVPLLQPGQAWDGRMLSYLGPMEYDRLKALGVGLEKAIYFGGFPIPESWAARYGLPTLRMEWIVVPTLGLMRWFHSYIPNYGVAIILLTVVTKVLFFPLTLKSMASMKAMQALQPQINTIRSKYKSDPQRMQQETMALYRAHKVNPLGGCLPMVVQVPIFYALYDALSVSVDLQNAPFLCLGKLFGSELWICDLAKPDPTYVLPLLMGASMFIQQKMTPVMGDPRQAKMMLFMPVLFTFMFLNLPSGLVLYWTVSNVLQIAQQKYMELSAKKLEKGPRAPKKAA